MGTSTPGGSKSCLKLLAAITILAACVTTDSHAEQHNETRPNVVLIVCDNLGYGDLGCFGSKLHRTPHVDQLAREGMRFTSFYMSAGVCTPSRASLMTGCYAQRVGLHWNERDGWVLRPVSPYGLHAHETTIAEMFRQAGYATAIIGKWHLGDQPEFLPTRHGFDTFFGIPYSDDMTPTKHGVLREGWPPLPLMRNERVVEAPVNRELLTQRYTQEAVTFIGEHADKPFFLYLPHAMPGSTTAPFSSPAFQGRSRNGSYGDAVEELDWSTGEIMSALQRHDLDRRTLVVWTSDNGAPRRNPPQGSAGPLKGFGYDTSEGAMRVCCVMRWPGTIPADSTCDELAVSFDLLPTFARLIQIRAAIDCTGGKNGTGGIDGKDISALLHGRPEAVSPHEAFFYYHNRQLQAVRDARYKLYLPLANKLIGGSGKTQPCDAELYDLRNDLRETTNLAAAFPEIVARLTGYAERARADLGDLDHPGSGQRAPGRVVNPTPRVLRQRDGSS